MAPTPTFREFIALSVHQPFAYFISTGRKDLEIRSWTTDYRGELLICATARKCRYQLPTGVAMALVELVDVIEFKREHEQRACVKWAPNMFAWVLSQPRPVRPFRVVGQQGLFVRRLPNRLPRSTDS